MIYNEMSTESLKFLLQEHEKQVKLVMSAVERENKKAESCRDLLEYREQKEKVNERRALLRACRLVRNSVMEELDNRGALL